MSAVLRKNKLEVGSQYMQTRRSVGGCHSCDSSVATTCRVNGCVYCEHNYRKAWHGSGCMSDFLLYFAYRKVKHQLNFIRLSCKKAIEHLTW